MKAPSAQQNFKWSIGTARNGTFYHLSIDSTTLVLALV
jgi:hypothetical protein